jgi:uncharacterized protein (UPF0276 family)
VARAGASGGAAPRRSRLTRAPAARDRAVGIAYRPEIATWIDDHADRLDVIEITVDHCIYGSEASRSQIFDLVGRFPLTAHGVGLSLGTDAPLDLAYLDRVAAVVDRLGAPAYSEHLAFTRVPGRELGNLLPLPRTEAVAASLIAKIAIVQARVGVPFLLENIACVFDWPDAALSEAAFLTLICRETGAGILLDVENLHLNAVNHGLDADAFLDALPAGSVKEIHVAGGLTVREPFLQRPFLADSHSHPVPVAALDLLDRALARQVPNAVVLERDDRLEASDELLADIAHIRDRVARTARRRFHAAALVGSAD